MKRQSKVAFPHTSLTARSYDSSFIEDGGSPESMSKLAHCGKKVLWIDLKPVRYSRRVQLKLVLASSR